MVFNGSCDSSQDKSRKAAKKRSPSRASAPDAFATPSKRRGRLAEEDGAEVVVQDRHAEQHVERDQVALFETLVADGRPHAHAAVVDHGADGTAAGPRLGQRPDDETNPTDGFLGSSF